MPSINAELSSEDLILFSCGREANVYDRRQRRRYEVDWPFRVKGTDPSGLGILNTGVLRDISPRGAYGYIGRALAVGMRMEVSIRLPLREERWMSYSAEIIRVEQSGSQMGVAMRFDNARPEFNPK